MTVKLFNLARMDTATTGVGTITLGSAVVGWLSFADAGVADGDEITYAIHDGTEREIGRGVYTALGTTLTRNVLKSTNSDAAINLSGSAQVFISAAAEDIIGYTGDYALTTSDDWQEIVENHDGNGTLTFADGTYTITGTLKPNARNLTLVATNNLGATIVGGWTVYAGNGLWIEGFVLEPPTTGMMISGTMSWIQLRDCDVDATAADTTILMQFQGCVFRIDSRDLTSTWTIGNGITTDVIDADEGTDIKIVGNVTAEHVQFNVLAGGPSISTISLDMSALLAAGFQMYAEGTAQTSVARGIEVRRGSKLTFQDTGNIIDGFDRGIVVRQGGGAHLSGLTISNCGTRAAWSIGSGNIAYDSTCVFTNNASNFGQTSADTVFSAESFASLAADGYVKLGNGVIIQWGTVSGSAGTTETFPIAFPTACQSITLTCVAADRLGVYTSKSTTSFSYTCTVASTAAASVAGSTYLAIGY